MGKNRACKKFGFIIIISLFLLQSIAFADDVVINTSNYLQHPELIGNPSIKTYPSWANPKWFIYAQNFSITANISSIRFSTVFYGQEGVYTGLGKYVIFIDNNYYGSYNVGTTININLIPGIHTITISNNSSNYVVALNSIEYVTNPYLIITDITTSTAKVNFMYFPQGSIYDVYLNGSKIATTTDLSYTITNLMPGTKYNISVKAGSNTADTSFTTLPGSIQSYNINISNITAKSFTVSWTDSNGPDTSYDLYINGTKIANTSNKQYTFNNLTPGTKYTIGIVAIAGGQSSASTNTTVYTLPDKPPSSPTLSASGQTLQWTKNDADQVKSFDIYQNGSKIATVDGNTMQYQVTGLERGVKYNFYITATNIAGTSQPSNTISITPPTPPSPPTGLQAKDIYNNQATIIWNKNIADDNVSIYSVYVNGSKVADVSSNTTSYTLQNLDPKTTYQVYVTATNAVGESNPSQSIYITTSLPGQVKNLHTQKLSSNSAELAWDANPVNDGVTKYIIYVNGNKAGETTDNSYTLSDIQQGKSYVVQVSAVNSVGEGQKSNIIQVTTSNITNISDISQVGDIFNTIIALFKNIWFLLAFVIMILSLPYLVIGIKLIYCKLKEKV